MKLLFIVLGCISLGLGVLGIFFPVLPTTPFLLLSAFLFAKSSSKLYDWLLNHKYLGPYIKDFLEHKSIPLRIKIISVSMLWATILISIYFVEIFLVRILLLLIACGVTFHILSFKTKK